MSGKLTAERDKLRDERKAANRRVAEAKQAAKDEWKLNASLLAPLWDRRYKPRALTPAFLRKFSDDLLTAIKERNLAFDLSPADRSVVLVDLAVREELNEAEDAFRVAAQRLRSFEQEHADELAAEAQAAEAEGIRDALAGDDPDAIRNALAGAAR